MERRKQILARYAVHQATGLRVERFEDGSAPSQVDALIWTADGPAALEIVAHHDSEFAKQWDALRRRGHELVIPGLRGQWVVSLAHSARVKDVVRELPIVMPMIEESWPDGRERAMTYDMPDRLANLGIRILSPIIPGRKPGHVGLRSEGWSGFHRPNPIPDFIQMVLSENADVPEKLAAHPGEQKHAFIWATVGTSLSVQDALEGREGQQLPNGDPVLPAGVTHVWVAGSLSSQGALAWFPERGWWRPQWRLPGDGRVDLGGFS